MTLHAQDLRRSLARIGAGLFVAALAGCATAPAGQGSNPQDPYEGFNRKMFAFNDTLDKYALKPAATAYQDVIPSPIRTGVHNFFGNFKDAWTAVNELLQGKPDDTARMTMRVLTNTVIGIGGLFDVATQLGIQREDEDFGQTLGRWGLEPGPYLVLPVFGPSDIRDALALPADTYVSPALLTDTFWQGLAVDTLGAIDTRANLLGASQMLNDIALDRYTFLRDAYIQRRRSLVYDGNPPDAPNKKSDDDFDPGATPTSPSPQSTPAPAPATPASGAKSSQAGEGPLVAAALAAQVPPSAPSLPMPPSAPGGVQPAPLPASAPTLPVPPIGPVPVPPPPASSAQA